MQLAIEKGTKPDSLTTQLVVYDLDLKKAEDKADYEAIGAERDKAGVVLFRVYPMERGKSIGPSREITIETKHLFGNQWNTVPDEYAANGFRVFNWYEEILPNANWRRGHYLTITQEMRDILRNTFKCGYCGAEFYGAHNDGLFCSSCLHSEYLKPKDFPLLRLKPLSMKEHFQKRADLTPGELEWLMPIYIERQRTGNDERGQKRRKTAKERILAKYEEQMSKVSQFAEERDGMLWLWDHNISIENVIYYSHTRTFSFGWRDNGLSKEVADSLRPILTNAADPFPFQYELKVSA